MNRGAVKLAPVAFAWLAACGGGGTPPSAEPAPPPRAIEPDAGVLRQLRLDAGSYLGCSAAATKLERASWSGDHGTYVARGCGFDVTYVVACDAPDRCGFTVAPD